MKTTADFLDDLRARHGLASDNKLALHMGWQRAQLGRYRAKRETFSDATALKVAEQLGIDAGYVMACMQGQRARTPETRSAWERIAAKVAAVLVLGLSIGQFDISTLSGQSGGPSPAGPEYTYCTNRRRWLKAWRYRTAKALSRFVWYLGMGAALASCSSAPVFPACLAIATPAALLAPGTAWPLAGVCAAGVAIESYDQTR